MVSREEDKESERKHLETALRHCGYPPWALKKVEDKEKIKKNEKKKKNEEEKQFKCQVVLPYVEGVTERIDRIMKKKFGIATAMKPHSTLRQLLVHPKDKCEIAEEGELVYKIPCRDCDMSYIGETGRLFRYRLEEHQKDVNSTPVTQFTRNARKQSQSTVNKSALTDHTTTENHEIDWEGAKVIDKEGHKRKRHVREAIWIRRTEKNMNRDEGNYELAHVYDDVILAGNLNTQC